MLKQLRNSPFFCLCLTFFSVSCIAAVLPAIPKIAAGILLIVLALIAAVLKKWILRPFTELGDVMRSLVLVFLGGATALGISFAVMDCYAASLIRHAGEEDTVVLEITDTVYTSSFNTRYTAVLRESGRLRKSVRLVIDTTDPSVVPGDILSGTIQYKAPEEDINGYNEKRDLLSEGIVIAADALALKRSGTSSTFSLARLFARFNHNLSSLIRRYMGNEGGLADALLLGNQEALSDAAVRDFRRLGISHLLCLSGAHLSILTTLLDHLLLKLGRQKKTRFFITSALVIVFMALTGFPLSLTRAGIMLIFSGIGQCLQRQTDTDSSLAVSCALIVLFQPFAALDWGLHLSFAAAHCCYISTKLNLRLIRFRPVKKLSKLWKLRRLLSTILRYAVTLTVFNVIITIHMLPLTWLYFGEMSLLAIPANLICIPLVTLIMYLTIAFLVLSPLSFLLPPIASMISWMSILLEEGAAFFSSLRGVVLPLNVWFAPLFMIPLALITITTFGKGEKILRRATAVSLGIFLLFFGGVFIQKTVDIQNDAAFYLTRGKNDGILIKDNGQLLVCEISDGSYSFAAFLDAERKKMNCAEIEAYMLTHYHNRQPNAFDRLSDHVIVRSLLLPMPVTDTDWDVCANLVAICEEKGIELRLCTVTDGTPILFNETEIQCYPTTLLKRSTHPVCAARFSLDDTELLYLGGSFHEGNAEILNDLPNADTVVLGAHSPVYKKAFAPTLFAETKTVCIAESTMESLTALMPNGFASESWIVTASGEIIPLCK